MYGMRSKVSNKEMIISKLHKQEGNIILAACDDNLIGKTLTNEHGAQIFINPTFYGNEKCSAEELIKRIKICTIANLFGVETIKVCKEQVSKIIDCNGVPHAQIIKII